MKDVFSSGDSSKKFKIAEGQWYRYAPSYVSPAYLLLEGFFFTNRRRHTDLQGDWSSDVCSFDPSRRRHTRLQGDWSSDVCSSDLLRCFIIGRTAALQRWNALARSTSSTRFRSSALYRRISPSMEIPALFTRMWRDRKSVV